MHCSRKEYKFNTTIHTTFCALFLISIHAIGPVFTGPSFSTPAFCPSLGLSSPAFLFSHFPLSHFSGLAFSALAFFRSRIFPVLHFPALEIWSLIFQSCRSVFDLYGPSLVPHFPVLHLQSTRTQRYCEQMIKMSYCYDLLESMGLGKAKPSPVDHLPMPARTALQPNANFGFSDWS